MNNWFKTLDRRNYEAYKLDNAIDLSGRDDVLALSVADSDYETAPEIIRALKKRVDHGAFGYAGVPSDFNDILVSWFERRYQATIKKDWILPAPKVLNALCVLIETLSEPNDKVLIQPPVYHVFKPAIIENNRTVIENELIKTKDGYLIDFIDFEEKLKQGVKLFILCSPHNPVGRVFTDHELKRMVELCKKYNVIILSDEIHADIIMNTHRFISLTEYIDAYDQIVIVSAPSKTFNIAGLQIAHMVIPNETIRNKVKHRYNELHISGPNLLAYTAFKAAYTKSDDWVDAQNVHIEKNYVSLKKFFESYHAKAWIAPLEATYLAWVDIGFTELTSKEFIEGLTKFGVVVSDGMAFSDQATSFIRINLACSKEHMDLAIARLNNYLDSLNVQHT